MYIEHDNIVDLLHQPILPEISASMLCISLLWCNKVSLSTFIVYGASVTCGKHVGTVKAEVNIVPISE